MMTEAAAKTAGKRTWAQALGEIASREFALEDPWRDRFDRERRERRLPGLICQLGRRYARCTLDNYELTAIEHAGEQGAVVARLREFCDNMPAALEHGGGLVLFGNPGTGKDHLLTACMFVALMRYGLDVQWIDGQELFASLREAIGTHQSERKVLDVYRKAQILVISDPIPPTDTLSDYNIQTIRRLADYRNRRHTSTWCSINAQGRADAEAILSRQVVDRLTDGALVLACPWESYRKPQPPEPT